VAAAGNQGRLASSALTRHVAVIPVAACDVRGRPMRTSNLAASTAKRGVLAPGEGFSSLTNAEHRYADAAGTSAAAPVVTGVIALLWSLIPTAPAGQLRSAVLAPNRGRPQTVVPALLDAWAAYTLLVTSR